MDLKWHCVFYLVKGKQIILRLIVIKNTQVNNNIENILAIRLSLFVFLFFRLQSPFQKETYYLAFYIIANFQIEK